MGPSSIRTKLAMALALPVVLVIGITVFEVAESAGDAREVRQQTDLAEAVIGPSGIVSALQDERTWASAELIGSHEAVTIPVTGYAETRAQTDAAIAVFDEEVTRRGGLVADAFEPAIDGLGDVLADLRAEIDAFAGARDLTNGTFTNEVFAGYSARIEPFFAATTRLTSNIADADLRHRAGLADTVARQIETLSLLVTTTVTETVLSGDGLSRTDIATISALLADFRSQAAVLRDTREPYAELTEERFPAGITESVDHHVQQALSTGQLDLEGLLAGMDVPVEEGYAGYKEALHRLIQDRADRLRAAAAARQTRYVAIALAALVGAVGLSALVSLSITRPLRSLTRQAKDLATSRLPLTVQGILRTPPGADVDVPQVPPVAVDAHEELASVASAMNALQDSALQLAVEQTVLRRNVADTFLNLGRRSQNLLVRQLEFLTELESSETDPDTLAALFQLDHLATRMRRNAESLLVLAGAGPTRSWTARVGLRDAILAGLGEVEDYRRVVVHPLAPVDVAGSVATDLSHVLAELLENALTFSSPDHHVEVRGHEQAIGYVLTITDAGLGMAATELARANRRLAGDESFAVPPSEYLGHYVAGRLAARHGIALRLEPTPSGGITAVVTLPYRLFTGVHAPAI